MDLLQKIDIKAADSGQNKIDNQARQGLSAREESADNKTFKDRLNDEVDQFKSQSNTEKTNDNQTDSESLAKQAGDERKEVENAEATDTELNNPVAETASESVNIVLQDDVNSAQLDAVSEQIIAGGLPVVGSELPLLGPLSDVMDIQNSAQGILIPASATSQQLVSNVEVSQLNKSGLTNKATQIFINQNTQLNAIDDAATAKPLNVLSNLATNLTERSNLQDAKFAKMHSEITTADIISHEIISKASRMQQVPVATAVSLNALTSQKILAGITNDVTGALNNLTPLSSAPQNLTPLSSLPASTFSLSIGENIQNPNWSQQLSKQVSYMVRGGIQQAEIKLNPAHLGPMEIKLSINDDQATVNFVAQHALVRDALDAALPRLKEMLEQQGLNLAGADVSTQSEQKQAEQNQTEQNQDGQHQSSSESQADSIADVSGVESTNETIMLNAEIKSGVSIFA